MRFGPVPVAAAEGAILAHALKLSKVRLAKGSRLSAADLGLLKAEGVSEVIAAVLADDDLTEDEAAARIGAAAAGMNVDVGPAGTGRVNFFAAATGLFVPDRGVVDRLNAIDPGITLATLNAFEPVEAGRMVATVKIIPLAVPGAAVTAALAVLAEQGAFRVSPYRARRIALVQTELPGIKKSILDKTRAALQSRLDVSGSRIVSERRCAHRSAALAEAIGEIVEADLTIVFGASAVIDPEDVIPAAVRAAGGHVLHLGMPVDPGNLLLLAEVGGQPLLGAPGCARSPRENGFDWVLSRLLADIPATGEDIRRMGVGGLLMEIASRPQPRAQVVPEGARPTVDIVILAAGRSSRMEGPNKLLATFGDVPLVRRSAETALASQARRVRVVVGHMRDEIVAALEGLEVELIENPRFADGLSTSLIAGFDASMREAADGALVMLADQPFLTTEDLDRLIAAFVPEGAGSIVLATDGARRGNPVVLPSALAAEVLQLVGDSGAKSIVARHGERVREVEIGAAASVDVDTPEAMARAGGLLPER